MLSNENPNPGNSAVENYFAEKAIGQSKALAASLTRCEHNPCPTDSRNVTNPGSTRIRQRRIVPSNYRIDVSQECKDQNSRASSLGHPELFSHLWGEPS